MNPNVKEQSINILELHTYSDVHLNVQIWNKNSIEHFVYLRIPTSISLRDCELVEILSESRKELDRSKYCRECKRIWIRVLSETLDMTVGQHTYTCKFVDTITDDEFSLYFSYVIQDDNPDTPYIYMKREVDKDGNGTICNPCKQILCNE